MTDAAIAAKQSVRAGIVEDPAEYRWSGYGAAVGGDAEARRGLCDVVSGRREGWGKSAEAYRMWLFDTGKREKEETPEESSEGQATQRKKARGGVDPEKQAEVLRARGRMNVRELLRHRVRYLPRLRSPGGQPQKSRLAVSTSSRLSDGAVIGSREF